MLTKVVKAHQARTAALKEDNEKKKKEVADAATRLSNALVDRLNVGVAQVFNNQRAIENEAKQLQASTARYCKQAQQWVALIDAFNQSLKEIGDVENWARTMENDVRIIAEALEAANRGEEAASALS